jgi:predicted Zn-dependent protease with MMP-like domain
VLRRRDRHGRGLRGPLLPPGVPGSRSRSEQFDTLVLDAVERLEPRWGPQLSAMEFAVEEVPAARALAESAEPGGSPVPLARSFPQVGRLPARIVVYRRPVERRAGERRELAALVHNVVVEQVAQLLGLTPESVDPRYGDPGA